MVMVDMAIMDTTVRDLLNLLLPLSQDMDMVMDMDIILVMDMVAMDITDITVRDLLRLNLDMGIMVMDMVMVMDMDMVMVMDTMVKQEPECCFRVQSPNEVFPFK